MPQTEGLAIYSFGFTKASGRILSYGPAVFPDPSFPRVRRWGSATMHLSNCRDTIRFGEFELDCDALELRRGRGRIPIRPKPLQLLIYLLTHRDRVVSKRELLDQVWRGVRVSDDALTSALRDLRRALGEGEGPHRMVVTVRARGYHFAASTREEFPAAPWHPCCPSWTIVHLADNPSSHE